MTNPSNGRLGPLVYLAANWISRLGVLLTTIGGVSWLFTLPLQLGAAGPANPYLALLTVFGLPLIFFTGLILIPIGIRLKERRTRRAGVYPTSFPPANWAHPEFRKLATFVLVATGANVIIGGHLTYSAVEHMDSVSFCGQSCHVMEPEFIAYQVAPHSNVACTDCHVGEGAGALIESKLNGLNQLVGVIFDSYPRPVPTPVHNLAQGQLTCAKCHSDRDLGSTRKEWVYFASDEANSATRTELLLHVGGGTNAGGAHGAHMANGAKIEYRSDPKRSTIPWMRYIAPDGGETVFAAPDWDPAREREFELRTMDCTDCHNRAAHSFENESKAIDAALAAGLIDASLPFVKREGLKAVREAYSSREEAARRIPEAIRAFYAGRSDAAVDTAARELLAIYERNVWPQFGVSWGVHPNHGGHEDAPGCFRCHEGLQVSQDAARRPVADDCSACHAIVADGQPLSATDGPRVTLTGTGRGLPGEIVYPSKAGPAPFDHAQHVDFENGDCTACHNRLFPMARADLNYAPDLHRAAEAAGSSCAGCHVSGGKAFASANNCSRCHTGLSAPPPAMARVAPATPSPLPGELRYETALGQALFDHAKHVDHSQGRCVDCHNKLFPMQGGVELNYGADLHRAAEAAKTSCAGCHVAGGSAFASAENCAQCHVGLGQPRATPPSGLTGIPPVPSVDTRLGRARFDHSKHIELADGKCTDCHNQVFPLAKGLLNYKDNLHRTAEAEKTSCGACHHPGGEAFASQDNCLKCHDGPRAEAQGSLLGLPDAILYANRLGDVKFDHDRHIADSKGDCQACHNEPWPMRKLGLKGYAEDYHRDAESRGTSCASCHAPAKTAFGTLNNCTRCHQDLELERGRRAAFASTPWAMLLLFAIPMGARGQAARPAATATGGYVGSDRCAVCHAEQFNAFPTNPHAAVERSKRWEAAEVACESCHGPGLAHVQALDPAALAVWGEGQPHVLNRACLDCHGGHGSQAGRFFSDHARNGLSCASCHQVHEAPARPLLAEASNALCAGCHADVSAAFNRPFRHKLHEGAIGCTDCHNPHGEAPPAQMTRVSANETVCLKCHADKRGPFPFEHAPVKMEPCGVCHEPHGSSNPRMMTRHDVGQLCLECHTTSLATLGGSPPAFHDLRSARFRNCTICHSKIHGSFVSRDYLR